MPDHAVCRHSTSRPSCATTCIVDEWVIVAAHRQNRTYLPPTPGADGCATGRHASAAQIVTSRRAAGKLKYLAGSESLAGAFINDVSPEEAAVRMRTAAGR
jgi:galactose-1-phosphate uridylyltransferase